MPLHNDRYIQQKVMGPRRRGRAGDVFLLVLCLIVAVFVGLARRHHLDAASQAPAHGAQVWRP